MTIHDNVVFVYLTDHLGQLRVDTMNTGRCEKPMSAQKNHSKWTSSLSRGIKHKKHFYSIFSAYTVWCRIDKWHVDVVVRTCEQEVAGSTPLLHNDS